MSNSRDEFDDAFITLIKAIISNKKPCWFITLKDGYSVSITKPKASELYKGTTAILYKHNIVNPSDPFVMDKIKSSN